MTFSELCLFVAEDLRPDGDSLTVIPAAGPYYTTRFGIRLALYLRQFSVETLSLFEPKVALTLAEDDWNVDLSNPAKCAKDIYTPWKTWLEGVEVKRRSSFESLRVHPDAVKGIPYQFAQIGPSRIHFQVPLAGNYQGFVQGWAKHPAITADNNVVQLSDDRIELFSRYVAAMMREDVASDEIGILRLQRLDKSAFDAVQKMKGDALRWMFNGADR